MKKDFSYYKKKKAKYETLVLIYITILAFFVILLISGLSTEIMEVIVTSVIGFIVFIFALSFTYKGFKNISIEFKETFLEDELHKVFPNSVYHPLDGISENEVYDSHVLKKEDIFKSEDMISGEFEGVKFRSSDVVLKDIRRYGKTTTIVTVFKGRVYEFEFNKRFKSNLLLIQPGKFRIFGPWRKIKMESIKFNSELKVYAENDHEAFYILTPHFMEKLLYLDKKYRDKINFSFINNKLYIAVNSGRDTFDLSLFMEFEDDILEDFMYEFQDMKEFIIELKLYNKIFISY